MPFEFKPTRIPDVLLITAGRFRDERGYFLETFRDAAFRENGVDLSVAQVNESVSCARTVRGMHYQLEPHAQGKLARVLRGSVLDVAVDLRTGSPTFGESVAEQLSADAGTMMWIPPGFAHGFCVTSDTAEFEYKCTEFYVPEDEFAVAWNDPQIAVAWPVEEPVLSARDAGAPPLADLGERLPVYEG